MKKNNIMTIIALIATTGQFHLQAMPGSDPSSYTPQTMVGTTSASLAPAKMATLNEEFDGEGLVGLYFMNSKTANIHDPSGINPTSYLFINITEDTSVQAPQGSVFIGTLTSNDDGTNSFAVRIINLYGQLQ